MWYQKILVNATLAFFVTLGSVNFAGLGDKGIIVALVSALITAFISALTECKLEIEQLDLAANPKYFTGKKSLANHTLIF